MIRLILSKRVPFFVSDLRRDQNAEALCSVIEGKRKILTLVCADTALTPHYYARVKATGVTVLDISDPAFVPGELWRPTTYIFGEYILCHLSILRVLAKLGEAKWAEQDVSLLTQGKHIGLSRIGNELVEGSIGLWFRCASNEWSTFEAFEEALGNFLRSFVAKHNL